MTATKNGTVTFKPEINVPFVMDVQYVDVNPGQYGPQVSLKGVVDNATVRCYLPGKVWANLKALKAGGVIGGYDESLQEATERTAVPVVAGKNVTFCVRKMASDKYSQLVVSQASHPVAEPPNLGGPIAGLDDEPPPASEAFEETAGQVPTGTSSATLARLNALFGMHAVCLDHAIDLAERAKKRGYVMSPESISALTAQAFIAATGGK